MDNLQFMASKKEKFDMVIGCSHNCYFKNEQLLYKNRDYFYKENKYLTKEEVRKMYVDIATNGVSHAPHNKMYKREIIDRYKLRFPDRKKYEDLAFNNNYIDKIDSLSIINSYDYNCRISDFEGVTLKLPEDMFEIFIEVNDELINLLKAWNFYDDRSDKMLKSKYITEVASCINNTYNPNLNYSSKKRYNYKNNIINIKKVQQACGNIEDFRFLNIISKLIKLRVIIFIEICYRLKIIYKKLKGIY